MASKKKKSKRLSREEAQKRHEEIHAARERLWGIERMAGAIFAGVMAKAISENAPDVDRAAQIADVAFDAARTFAGVVTDPTAEAHKALDAEHEAVHATVLRHRLSRRAARRRSR